MAHADVDLKVGGKMLTHYDPKGKLGDPNTIENIILSFEPKRMLSIKVANPPGEVPLQERDQDRVASPPLRAHRPEHARGSRSSAWATASDEESKKLRDFFDKGNAYTLKKLQEKFAARPVPPKPAASQG